MISQLLAVVHGYVHSDLVKSTELIDCCCVSTLHVSVMHASSSMHFPHACIQPAKAVVCLSKPK